MDETKFLQASENSKTTIIFVPGAWHNALCFLGVGTKIEHAGFKVRYVTLPTCGVDCHLSTMDMDLQQIRKAISEEADTGRLVMVVCHSYGGVRMTIKPRPQLPSSDLTTTRHVTLLPRTQAGGISPQHTCIARRIGPFRLRLRRSWLRSLPMVSISGQRLWTRRRALSCLCRDRRLWRSWMRP